MLFLNINRKQCMGSSVATSHFPLNDLETSNSRSLRFQSVISRKGGLGHLSLLNIDRK